CLRHGLSGTRSRLLQRIAMVLGGVTKAFERGKQRAPHLAKLTQAGIREPSPRIGQARDPAPCGVIGNESCLEDFLNPVKHLHDSLKHPLFSTDPTLNGVTSILGEKKPESPGQRENG